ncbi:MAG: ATP-binding protein [Tistlia sp.]|uniref:GAF domain-containing sensor histidine kinase n=1 Tax=Tistlia sp. TaxID=3057121 RepID=UPI0034A564F1
MCPCNLVADAEEPAESPRLDALDDYESLDSQADARFERIVGLAADLLDVPIALVSLLEEDRLWLTARFGLALPRTPRDWAFCSSRLLGEELLVVEDATLDARLAGAPLVAGAPGLRFYAGVPLVTPQGRRIGALCVLDRRPRRFAAPQRRLLRRLASTVVDLTESLATARALERKERRLSLAELSQMEQIRYGRIFENSLNEIYLFDALTLRIVAANRGARENLGYGEPELRDLTPLDLMPGVGLASFERLLDALRGGRRRSVLFERPQRRKDGTSYPAEVTLELDSSGDWPLFVALVQDATEKRTYRRDLGRALELTRSILEACQEAIASFRPLYDDKGEIADFECLQANAAARRMHGLPAGEMVGARLLDLWPGWRGTRLPGLLREVVLQREPVTLERSYADGRRDGWFRISAAATGEGGLTLVIADIGEQKQHERALQRSNQALDQFAGGVAHDLQTPIGQIAGFTSLLERHLGTDIPPKARATMGYIAQATENMSRLVSSLLDFARLGRLTFDPQPVALRQLVEQCLEEVAGELGEAKVSLSMSDLPEIPGNATLLKQVFQNLIGNALKYRSAAPLALTIHGELTPSSLRIFLEDNGIGIEARHAERIFEVFRRLHADGSPYPGLGMGLALTKTIVEAHDGRIWLDTARPATASGSRFVVELPLSLRESGAAGPAAPLRGRCRPPAA